MLLPCFYSSLLVLFWAFTAAVSGDTAEELQTKIIYLDSYVPSKEPEFKRSLFPELIVRGGDLSPEHFQPTFYREAPAFIKKISRPLHKIDEKTDEDQEHGKSKNIGKFRKAFLLSKRDKKDVAIPNANFITAVSREMRAITELPDIQWWTPSETTKHRNVHLTLEVVKDGSEGTFSINNGHPRSILDAKFTETGELDITETNSKLITPSAFNKKSDKPNTLTTVQRLWHEREPTPTEILPSSFNDEPEKPYAKSLQLAWSQSGKQIFRYDGNTKPIDITIMLVTTKSVWILMLPKSLVSKADSNGIALQRWLVNNIRMNPWFQTHIMKIVRDRWEEATKVCPKHSECTKDQPQVHGVPVGFRILNKSSSTTGKTRAQGVQGSRLVEAIIQEIWAMDRGPLKRDFKPLPISYIPFLGNRRLTSSGDSLFAPTNWFVIENEYNDWCDVSVLQALYGPHKMFAGMFENSYEGSDPLGDEAAQISLPSEEPIHQPALIQFEPLLEDLII